MTNCLSHLQIKYYFLGYGRFGRVGELWCWVCVSRVEQGLVVRGEIEHSIASREPSGMCSPGQSQSDSLLHDWDMPSPKLTLA